MGMRKVQKRGKKTRSRRILNTGTDSSSEGGRGKRAEKGSGENLEGEGKKGGARKRPM